MHHGSSIVTGVGVGIDRGDPSGHSVGQFVIG
jgi:hypothetical protein